MPNTEAELDAAIDGLGTDLAEFSTDFATLTADFKALHDELATGAPITDATMAKVSAIQTSLDDAKTALGAIVTAEAADAAPATGG